MGTTTTASNPDDDRLSFAEAWARAGRLGIRSGETVTIEFASAMRVSVTGTLRLRSGADVVIGRRIRGDNSLEIGTNDVPFTGNGAVGYNPGSRDACGYTMFDIDTGFDIGTGAALRMADVGVASHPATGGAGRSGVSGGDGAPDLSAADFTIA